MPNNEKVFSGFQGLKHFIGHLATVIEPLSLINFEFDSESKETRGPSCFNVYYCQTLAINPSSQALNSHRSNNEAKMVAQDVKLKWPLPLHSKKFTTFVQSQNLNCIWLGSSIPSIIIEAEPSTLEFEKPGLEKNVQTLADVIAIHDSSFHKKFCDKFFS